MREDPMTEIAWPQEAHAVCGAYLIVAFADGRFDRLEEARVLAGLANHDALKHLSSDEIETVYNGLSAAFQRNYTETSNGVLKAIEGCRHDDRATQSILVAARAAVVADQAVLPQEETVLNRISAALGLEEGTV